MEDRLEHTVLTLDPYALVFTASEPQVFFKLDYVVKSISNLSLYSLYYVEACNELAGPVSALLHPGNTAPFEEMLQ